MNKAKISEVFSSLQGEGIYVGLPQVFIRFFGCNLNCDYCDTKLKQFELYSPDKLSRLLGSFKNRHHSLCLTGGEPLLQIGFLEEFLKITRKKNTAIYLETNGTLFKELKQVIDKIDIIAMDLKLPSSNQGRAFWGSHEKFLKIAAKKDFFVKIVITKASKKEELEKAIGLLSGFNHKNKIRLALQPNSFELGNDLMRKILEFQNNALRYFRDVRIVPQVHKLLRIK